MPGASDLSDSERSVLTVHPHWKTVLWPAVLLLIVVVVASMLLVTIPHSRLAGNERIAVGIVALLVAAIWTGVPFLRWRTTTYELTTRRIRLRSGILTRTGRDFPLVRISDISYSAGPIDRLLRTGKLTIEAAGEHGELVLNELPDVQKVQATLFQLVEDEEARLAREERRQP